MELEPQLSIEVIWKDDEMFETRVIATNGRYLGTTKIYNQSSPLANFAGELKGFPESVEQVVEYKAGEIDSYAYFSMRFYCVNFTGHTAVQVQLEENVATEFRPEEKSKLSIEIRFEPNELDKFQNELLALAQKEEGKAVLSGKKA